MNTDLRPFTIEADPVALKDLRRRLEGAQLPPTSPGRGWRFGTPIDFVARLREFWLDGYDWTETEGRLNEMPNFQVDVSGIPIHLIRLAGEGSRRRALLITHGWPGSVIEFLDVMEPLAFPSRFGGDRESSFDIIVPSLPGYGWSGAPAAPMSTREIAAMWVELVRDHLGLSEVYVQGGDWGSLVSSWMAIDAPDLVTAIHINMMGLRPYTGHGSAPLSSEEQRWLEVARQRLRRESGYQVIQGTKPLTLSYGLHDSPLALAAWIIEKFQAWSTDTDHDPPFTLARLLDNVMVYWLTGTIGTSTWLYTSARTKGAMGVDRRERVEAPTGFLASPNDLFPPPPNEWIARVYNCVDRVDRPKGGHFAAMEDPDGYVAAVRDFFANVKATEVAR